MPKSPSSKGKGGREKPVAAAGRHPAAIPTDPSPRVSPYGSEAESPSYEPTPVAEGRLTPGRYRIRIIPSKQVPGVRFYEGILRVTELDSDPQPADPAVAAPLLKASADIYVRPITVSESLIRESQHAACIPKLGIYIDGIKQVVATDPLNSAEVFPRRNYAGYLEAAPIREALKNDNDNPAMSEYSYSARFRFHRFDQKTREFATQSVLAVTLEAATEDLRARTLRTRHGLWEPEFRGRVINESTHQDVGIVEVRHIDENIRKATIKITGFGDAPGEAAEKLVNAKRWATAFSPAGWKVKVKLCEPPDIKDIKPDLKVPWTDSELLAALERFQKIASPATATDPAPLSDPDEPFDREWCYHIICVDTFENPQYERGVTFDMAGLDHGLANFLGIPIHVSSFIEGSAIAAGWPIPRASEPEPEPEPYKPVDAAPVLKKSDLKTQEQSIPQRLDSSAPTVTTDPEDVRDWEIVARTANIYGEADDLFFRTAVHEIGHAMGLGHRFSDFGFMNTTDVIARRGMAEYREAAKAEILRKFYKTNGGMDPKMLDLIAPYNGPKKHFPDCVNYAFAAEDIERLQHAPDVMVRPGAFNASNLAAFDDEPSRRVDDFRLRLVPLLRNVPYGAPVRIKLKLVNVSTRTQSDLPRSLHLKSGLVSGVVISPGGKPRPFDALMKGIDSDHHGTTSLAPGEALCHSMTLWKGHGGPLFGSEGIHTVKIRVQWHRNGEVVHVIGETIVNISPPAHTANRTVADNILTNPRSLLALVVGVPPNANASIDPLDAKVRKDFEEALADPILAPHLRLIEIKRLIQEATRSGSPRNLLQQAHELLTRETVMSMSEIHRLQDILNKFSGSPLATEANNIGMLLQAKKRLLLVTEPVDEAP